KTIHDPERIKACHLNNFKTNTSMCHLEQLGGYLILSAHYEDLYNFFQDQVNHLVYRYPDLQFTSHYKNATLPYESILKNGTKDLLTGLIIAITLKPDVQLHQIQKILIRLGLKFIYMKALTDDYGTITNNIKYNLFSAFAGQIDKCSKCGKEVICNKDPDVISEALEHAAKCSVRTTDFQKTANEAFIPGRPQSFMMHFKTHKNVAIVVDEAHCEDMGYQDCQKQFNYEISGPIQLSFKAWWEHVKQEALRKTTEKRLVKYETTQQNIDQRCGRVGRTKNGRSDIRAPDYWLQKCKAFCTQPEYIANLPSIYKSFYLQWHENLQPLSLEELADIIKSETLDFSSIKIPDFVEDMEYNDDFTLKCDPEFIDLNKSGKKKELPICTNKYTTWWAGQLIPIIDKIDPK
ncbi:5955_t:CDS:2, partial [Cetraspora pellucida]